MTVFNFQLSEITVIPNGNISPSGMETSKPAEHKTAGTESKNTARRSVGLSEYCHFNFYSLSFAAMIPRYWRNGLTY